MAGLLALLAVALWVAASVAVAKAFATKAFPIALIAVTLFFMPFVDEAIGQWQYSNLCQRTEVKVHGVVPVGSNLYAESGEWRLGMKYPGERWKERQALVILADSLVRWDHGSSMPRQSIIPIDSRHTRIFDRKTERLLAEWTSYSFKGGIIRRSLFEGSSQCFPKLFQQEGNLVYKEIMSYSKQ